MWTITSFVAENGNYAYMSDGKPIQGTQRGPAGTSCRLYVDGIGMLDITDNGQQPGGPQPWQLVINSQLYWYDGNGTPAISVNSNGTFIVTGNSNDISGQMHPLPIISPDDLQTLDLMKSENLIPYTQLQSGERPYSDVESVALQYFAFSPAAVDLGLTVYDWTSADFARMDFFHLFRYSAVSGMPLDDQDIINGIWTSKWPPYTPQDGPFMWSFMMQPAQTEAEVAAQYAQVSGTLSNYLNALMRLTSASMYAMPRTATVAKPMLYSGQVAISNLTEDIMAVYFEEYPGNAGPVGFPMGMPITEALNGFMAPGNVVTLKTFISFTDSQQDAQHYSNGIIIEMSPAPGSAVWTQSPYITPLSNGPTKTEYTYSPGAKWQVTGSRVETIDGKTYTVISTQDYPG